MALAAATAATLCARPSRSVSSASLRLAVSALAAAAVGIVVGELRLDAIDSGALRSGAGREARVVGWLAAAPRTARDGRVGAEIDTVAGRLLVLARGTPELELGVELAASGRLREPESWRSGALERRGIALVLEARRLAPTGRRRGGIAGRLDAIRSRAERGLGRGMPEREAALARGFVLGQDDRIDPATREDFRRSGLAHLLAVSGQNVMLLCLLAWPLLALFGLTLRARLLALLVLIAVYVPVTGAGPSIQRAGAMGAAGLVATLADRPRSRWYALALAAAATLALNPRACGDVGWQLSFAAVVGLLVWTPRISALLDGGAPRGSPRRALAEGLALTTAATLATAPLMAHHFDSLSLAALPANLLALPAVAPAMWLGMLTSIVAQLPALPVEPLNWLGSLCLAYIAQVARWLGGPEWALLEVRLGGPAAVAAAYAALAAAIEAGLRIAARAGERNPARGGPPAAARRPGRRRWTLPAAAGLLAALALLAARAGDERPPSDALVVRVLDAGQGDAILLDPPAGAPVLVDAGPPRSGVPERLRELGVEALGALVVSHPDSDHAGGVAAVSAVAPPARIAAGAPDPALAAAAAATGAPLLGLAEGTELRSGALRLSVLWPPAAGLGPADEPNRRSLVLLAEWGHFSMLLTGDAEAEAVPLDPGPVDALKLAHHGSEDAGLGALLERTAPRLAVISVGENPYGHPTPQALAELAEHDVRALRTDQRGEVVIAADAHGWRVESAAG